MQSVEFKSLPMYYDKEYSGKKPNTIRKLEKGDPRFLLLRNSCVHPFCNYLKIKITNTKTSYSFVRDIKDITYFDDYVIISWEHIDE